VDGDSVRSVYGDHEGNLWIGTPFQAAAQGPDPKHALMVLVE
jgi:hypothetical protein